MVIAATRRSVTSSVGRLEEAITVMYWYGDHMSGWGWALMTVGTITFWALVIVGIVLLVRYLGHSGQQPTQPTHTPEQLLAERFARGEIDQEEYRDRLATLRGQLKTQAPQ